jgi:hypothetical protein
VLETYDRCREHWFSIQLKDNICHACFLRDTGNKTPFLISADNKIDPGELPGYLPELIQVEEMIIACTHVQMLVHRYCRYQYYYSGHCISFIQNIVKTVDMLPNLLSELDIVLLQPPDSIIEKDLYYQYQFRSNFQV